MTLTQSCPPTPDSEQKEPFHIPIRFALFDDAGQPLPLQQEVLELREAEETFRFPLLSKKPVVSLLRDFSAPIKLHTNISDEDLLFLLRFERDGFAKWDAAQTLALKSLRGYYHTPRSEWQGNAPLLAAYRHVLQDDTMDKSLRAELLFPPGFEAIASGLTEVDVTLVDDARRFFLQTEGEELFADLEACYHKLWQEETHVMNKEAYGRRKLRNTCLHLMMEASEEQALSLCHQQFLKAKTMTDLVMSFALLMSSSDESLREEAIHNFYQQWQHDDLVVDKWFAIQATAELPDVLSRVKALLSHPAFHIKNPNKVRALVGAFSQSNRRYFHAIDGSGYAFLTDVLLTVDKINPQIASRLAVPFTRWQRLNLPRQQAMKAQLQRLSGEALSRDLQELVSKSL